jgi:hypothetical protein
MDNEEKRHRIQYNMPLIDTRDKPPAPIYVIPGATPWEQTPEQSVALAGCMGVLVSLTVMAGVLALVWWVLT